ncbi:MAG: hypothetical protein CL912_18930 [Deltaproteobacteria bacterium]|nr:hypothetical protein [Deltaproteobacteria bacterium]
MIIYGRGKVWVHQTAMPTTGIVSVKYPAEMHMNIAPMIVCIPAKMKSTRVKGSSPSTTDIS